MRRMLRAVLVLVAVTTNTAAEEPLRAEANRRHDELVKQGFNLTHGLSLGIGVTRVELVVPPSVQTHLVSLWFAAPAGVIRVRMTGPDSEVVTSWQATRGEQLLSRTLAPGSYVVEASGAAGEGLIGVKGPVIGSCALDARRVSEHPPDPTRGFRWPYLLVTPKGTRATALLVLPNNTGFVSDDVALLRASARCALRDDLATADRLGVALLTPLFPRPPVADAADNLYLHALSRAALTAKAPAHARVDLQLIAMIDDARAALGEGVAARVLIAGFSASASFANRFAILHPERVLAAAVGSPGGWPIAPIDEAGLTYPVGIADVERLTGRKINRPTLQKVHFLFMLGADDNNDSVPYRDSFSAADEALIMRRFGKTPVARWDAARRLYEHAGLHATFRLYPRVGHTMTPEMRADVEAAFASALRTLAP